MFLIAFFARICVGLFLSNLSVHAYVCNTPEDWILSRHGSNISVTNWSPGSKWPGGVVKYEFHSSLSSDDKNEAYKAFDEFHRKTCIRFVPRGSGDSAYTSIEADEGVCGLAHVCRTGGYQFAKFGGGCRKANVMIHELGHTLCMGHEQTRPDRDSYVEFPSCSANDTPGKDTENDVRGSTYDYTSQMHYQCNWCPGGWPKNKNVKSCGSDVTPGLSVLDVDKINEFYDCGGCLSYRFRNFQQLSGSDVSSLLAAGNDPYQGTTYACRGYHPSGDIIPGKYDKNNKVCYLAYGGSETGIRGGDVLTNPKNANLKWVKATGNIPSKAVAGGRTKEGETLYVVRGTITVDGKVTTIAGKMHANYPGAAYVSYGGREYGVTDFEILVCSG